MEVYIYTIILIVLLFVALVAIIIYVTWRRRLLAKPMRQPLVDENQFSPYEMKWQMAAGVTSDGPPPYNVANEEKKAPPPADDMVAHYQTLDVNRVPVTDDDPKDFDNPTYSTVTEAGVPAAISAEVKVDEYKPELEEGVPSYTNPAFESEQLKIQADVSENETETEGSPDKEDAITVTFTEGESPNTVAAHVVTPGANLTINLNINLPDETTEDVEAAE